MKYCLIILALITLQPFSALADLEDCIYDCSGNYQSETDNCQSSFGDDPDSNDDLSSCNEDALSSYEYYKEECESEHPE